MKEMIEDILANWNLEEATVKQVYDSAWQVGEEFVLKVYDNVGALNRNIKMLSILDDMGIPVHIPLERNSQSATAERLSAPNGKFVVS